MFNSFFVKVDNIVYASGVTVTNLDNIARKLSRHYLPAALIPDVSEDVNLSIKVLTRRGR